MGRFHDAAKLIGLHSLVTALWLVVINKSGLFLFNIPFSQLTAPANKSLMPALDFQMQGHLTGNVVSLLLAHSKVSTGLVHF